MYADVGIENNDKDPKFKVVDNVRISKYKYIFAKVYVSNRGEDVFVNKKVKGTVQWKHVIKDLNSNKIFGKFHKKELQKTNKTDFRVEKVIKRNGNKLYVKWQGYDNSFNSWFNKKYTTIIRSTKLCNKIWLKKMQKSDDTSNIAKNADLACLKSDIDN